MDSAIMVGLEQEVIAELTIELGNEPDFNSAVLLSKVRNAIREVRMRRNYSATSYTEEQIAKDLYNFFSVVKNVALYDYNLIGAEGEQSHSENGVSRSYASRESLFKGVIAFCKVF